LTVLTIGVILLLERLLFIVRCRLVEGFKRLLTCAMDAGAAKRVTEEGSGIYEYQ
jgi:hypothetical protein